MQLSTHHFVDRSEYLTVTAAKISMFLLVCPSQSALSGGKHLNKWQDIVLRWELSRDFLLLF